MNRRSVLALIALPIARMAVNQKKALAARAPPTPMPTAAPFSGKPVFESNGIQVLYLDTIANVTETGWPMMIGELRNVSDHVRGTPFVNLTLLDADGNIVDTNVGLPNIDFFAAGETMPFEASWVNSTNRPKVGAWQSVGFDFQSRDSMDSTDWDALKLTKVSITSRSAVKFAMSGSVKNTGSHTTKNSVFVWAAGYSPAGRYLGGQLAQLGAAVPAGKSENFTIDSFEKYPFPGTKNLKHPDEFTIRMMVGEF